MRGDFSSNEPHPITNELPDELRTTSNFNELRYFIKARMNLFVNMQYACSDFYLPFI